MFKSWILEGLSIKVINRFKGTEQKTLNRHFNKFLDNPPSPKKPKQRRSIWLKADAKYFGKRDSPLSFCVILYKEGKNLIYWRFAKYETFAIYVSDLILLNSWGYTILGITSDWHKSIVGAVKYLHKDNVPHQRCLVHLKQKSESLLTRNPKTREGKELLELVKYLNIIKTKSEANAFVILFESYGKRHKEFLKERTYYEDDLTNKRRWFYTHKNVRRVYRSIHNSLNNIFLHLDYEGLDKDTNGLESEFSHLTGRIQFHRGLKLEKKESAVSWYIYFKIKERNH